MRKGAGNRDCGNHLTPCLPGATVNVPVHLVDNFPENLLVVRSGALGALVERIDDVLGERIDYVQLTDLDADPSPFIRWKQTFALDLTMTAPGRQFSRLYAFAPLLDRGPVRVQIPAVDGVRKAVKLASSLRFSVAIVPGAAGRSDSAPTGRTCGFLPEKPGHRRARRIFPQPLFRFCKRGKDDLVGHLGKKSRKVLLCRRRRIGRPPAKAGFLAKTAGILCGKRRFS